MYSPVMAATEGKAKLVADLTTQGARLRKPEMVGVGGPSATNQAGLLRNKLQMIFVPNPTRLRNCQDAFVDRF
jgi:hypothetical protein